MAVVELNTGYEDEYDMYGYGGMDSDGNEENSVELLFEQFNIAPDDLPQYRLFLKGDDIEDPHKYKAETGDLSSWIQSNGIYFGLQGYLAEFDELVKQLLQSK